MKRWRPSTFSRYSLALDAAAFAAVSLLLLAAVALTLLETGRKYLELRVADAGKVELFLANRFESVQRTLEGFADLPEEDRSPPVLEYFSSFSEIYRLDGEMRVARIYKQSPQSKVFPGFAITRGKLAEYLRGAVPGGGFSPMVRGPEDDAASVYLATRRGEEIYTGRLDLDFIREFLVDYSGLAGTPVLLVSPEGFVIATGNPELELYAFDPKPWEGPPSIRRTLDFGGARWIPVVSEPRILGNRLVTLIPTAQLDIQRNALVAFWVAASVLLGAGLFYKNRKVDRLVLRPLSRLSAKMREVETGAPLPEEMEESHRFREFGALEDRFRSMARAIRVRERELGEASERAEAATRAKSAFLANMSHEIRTPLSGIIGLTGLALRDGKDPGARGYLAKIGSSARSLLGILNEILDLSKIEARQMRVERLPFRPRAVAESVAALMEAPARERGLVLSLDCQPTGDEWRAGDELRLKQVLLNLVSNAIKFTEAGAVALSVGTPSSGRLRFEVCDTGPGLTPEQQEKVFQPFRQADDSTTRRYGGTGLGLTISQELVELMGGRIEVRSEPGRGSVFSFEIDAPACTAPAGADVAGPVKPPDLSGRRVMVADDSAINREIVAGLLGATGADVIMAANGREAVEKFREHPCDFVFMDVQMPLMDGHAATREIRALDAQVPVVALSASVLPEDVARSHAAGLNEHVLKPLEADDLHRLLARYVPAGPRAAAHPVRGPMPASLHGMDPALYNHLLGLFVQEFSGLPTELRRDLASGDHTSAARRLHKLQGSAGALGQAKLSATASLVRAGILAGGTVEESLSRLEGELSAFLDVCAVDRSAHDR